MTLSCFELGERMLAVEEARAAVLALVAGPLPAEVVLLARAHGRVLAEDAISPIAVRRTRLEITSYNGMPTASVISRSCIDAVGCVTCCRRAAALTLPVSANARKSCSWRKLTFI